MRSCRGGSGQDRAQQAVGLCPNRLSTWSESVIPVVDVLDCDPVDALVAERRVDIDLQELLVVLMCGRSQRAASDLAVLHPVLAVGTQGRCGAAEVGTGRDLGSPDLHLDLGAPG